MGDDYLHMDLRPFLQPTGEALPILPFILPFHVTAEFWHCEVSAEGVSKEGWGHR